MSIYPSVCGGTGTRHGPAYWAVLRGPWTTGSFYRADDAVWDDDVLYVCTTPHTSSTDHRPRAGSQPYWGILARPGDHLAAGNDLMEYR